MAAGEVHPDSVLADHRTPFIFNEWYVAALSEEIARELMARTLLDRSVLFFRKLDGSVAAIRNRCPIAHFRCCTASSTATTWCAAIMV